MSLIAGLENGLEGWNGLWNGIWSTAEASLCVLASSSLPTLSDLRRVSFTAVKATSHERTYMYQLKLIKYVRDLCLLQLPGGLMSKGPW